MVNLKMVFQVRYIEDLKLRFKGRNEEIVIMEFVLLSKEDEIDKMRGELIRKSIEVVKVEIQFKLKVLFLDEVNEVVRKQEIEF